MNKYLRFTSALALLVAVSLSCKDDKKIEPDIDDIDEEILAVNKWIQADMKEYYFWEDKMPDINYEKEEDSKEYFNKLLYKPGEVDRFSYITDNYKELESDFNGEPVALGFGPSFYLASETGNKVIALINYVYPGSAAELAGLRRGHVITKINGAELNSNNYAGILSNESYSVELGKLTVQNQALVVTNTGVTFNLSPTVPNPEPIIKDSVIVSGSRRIGYVAYVSFISGADDKYLESMSSVFEKFENITDLIVDLRYNPGGDMNAAIHLASIIAPRSVATKPEVLVTLSYNKKLQASNLYTKNLPFDKDISPNMNLQKVVFLTTQNTASASELVMVGLDPYMEVIKIGDSTYGKPYGAYILPDDNEEWAIVPIVMQYANTDGYTGFDDGIAPDYEVTYEIYLTDPSINNDMLYCYPLGDDRDDHIEEALAVINGTKSKAARTAAQEIPQLRRLIPSHLANSPSHNLIVPMP